VFKKFFPRQEKFYELLTELSLNIQESGILLNKMIVDRTHLSENSSSIHILENKCDELTHKIIHELNETFITPIDREDIHELTNSLDNIIDAIDAIATRVHLYKIKYPIPFGPQLSGILLSQVNLLADAVKNLKDHDNIFDELVQIRNLETEGDSVFRDSISDLFENEKDVIEIIKKKEILENIERAVDRCQTATIVIEGILIKNI
jgi:predicted phosphate transport protein (TIGR00153 family)